MFELNGEQYSLEQVQEAAKKSNLSLDNYIAKHGIIKLDNEGKTNGAAAKGATATPETGQAPESLGLGLEDSSSELNFKLNGEQYSFCLLYTSPSPRDRQKSRMPSSA